jgi:hypothetical protein
MSLDMAGPRVEFAEFPVAASSAGFARSLMSWLASLGPVLLIRDPGARRHARCERSCAIDTYGVREALHFDDSRVYRLADSDYFGWDHATSHCVEAGARRIERDSSFGRRAYLVRGHGRAWMPVAQLSALGWQQVREILHMEGARLEHLPFGDRELSR